MKTKTYRVVWAAVARGDLVAILDYIAKDNPVEASRVLARIERRARTLAMLPARGRVVPELPGLGVTAYRELVVAPWRIVYRVDGDSVNVLGVLDARRALEDLLLERFVRPTTA